VLQVEHQHVYGVRKYFTDSQLINNIHISEWYTNVQWRNTVSVDFSISSPWISVHFVSWPSSCPTSLSDYWSSSDRRPQFQSAQRVLATQKYMVYCTPMA